jgi:hypothetical protein
MSGEADAGRTFLLSLPGSSAALAGLLLSLPGRSREAR